MRVGVIAEGPADFAVVRSILKAVLGLDAADVDSIRPDLQSDETSLHTPSARTFSNWEIVKQECIEGASIKAYLANIVDEVRLVVVHIDTAECHLPGYGVVRPPRDAESYVATAGTPSRMPSEPGRGALSPSRSLKPSRLRRPTRG